MELDDGGDRLYNTISDTDSNESQPISRSARRHDFLKTLAGVVGNAFEWYDFAIFGFFSDVIADVFFPKQEGSAALIESFAIFGGAFFMRPGEFLFVFHYIWIIIKGESRTDLTNSFNWHSL